jgi:hypothetical protein
MTLAFAIGAIAVGRVDPRRLGQTLPLVPSLTVCRFGMVRMFTLNGNRLAQKPFNRLELTALFS